VKIVCFSISSVAPRQLLFKEEHLFVLFVFQSPSASLVPLAKRDSLFLFISILLILFEEEHLFVLFVFQSPTPCGYSLLISRGRVFLFCFCSDREPLNPKP
ncbi:MAG: hypothetical protein J6Q48_00295, partial [Bacteroidaceae bacterium]|nr:hypothetical protein [Bacteroidaceae bacterium]